VSEDALFRVVVESGETSEGTQARRGADAQVPRALFRSQPKELDFDKIKKDWTECLTQLRDLTEVADSGQESPSGFRLTEIDLGLTITAEGHLAFIASASASATLQVKFTRS
jgi:Trypsin-co-occurring domain 1